MDGGNYFAYFGFIDAGLLGRTPGIFNNLEANDFSYFFPALSLAVIAILRILFQRQREILVLPSIFAFGYVMGNIWSYMNPGYYGSSTAYCSIMYIHFAVAVNGFHTTYNVDFYSFRRKLLQILPFSLTCLACHSIIVTSIAYPILHQNYNWPFEIVIAFVLILAPSDLINLQARFEGVQSMFLIDPMIDSHKMIRYPAYVKDIQDILQSTEIINYGAATFSVVLFHSIASTSGSRLASEICWLLLSYPLSVILGLSFLPLQKYVGRTADTFFIFTISTVFMGYCLCKFVGFTGAGSVIVYGVVIKTSKFTLNTTSSHFVKVMLDFLYRMCSYASMILAGFIVGSIDIKCTFLDLGCVLAIYLCCFFVRFLAFMISSIFIIGKGNQITWKHIKVAALGVNKGPPTMFLALFFSSFYAPYKFIFMVYISSIIILSTFFNGVLARGFLRIEGMYDLTRSRIINMNSAMFRINQCRERAMFSLKLNTVVSDANWRIVDVVTRLRHPYGKKLKDMALVDLGDTVQMRFVKCDVCNAETLAPLTKREFDILMSDAKQRITKTQMVSYYKQHEQGTLSIEGLRHLINLVELSFAQEAMLCSDDVKIQTEGTRAQLRLLKFFQWLHAATWMSYKYIPQDKIRHFLFEYTTSHQFRIAHSFIAFFDIGLTISTIIMWYCVGNHDEYRREGYFLQVCDLFFCLYFILEFALHILSIGFTQYFAQQVNIVEFHVSLLARPLELFIWFQTSRLDAAMKDVDPSSNPYSYFNLNSGIIFGIKFLQILRLCRLYVLVAAISPQIVATIERKIKCDVMKSYDIGKAYLMSIDRVTRILATMVNNDSVLQELRKVIEQERLKMSKELGLIQKDVPSIAVTVKTKHAVQTVINTIHDCLTDMKEEGILDSIEHKCLLESLDEIRKNLREIEWIEPCPPDFLLSQIRWLSKNGAEFFLLHAELQNYDFNDVLIRQGDDPVGIFILVSGLLKCVYKPSSTTSQLSSKFGVLPNYDFFTNTKFLEPQEEIAVTGNVIGEIGLVTGRRYDMTVMCDTAVQAYFVPWEIVRELIYLSPDSDVIQARIWKTIGSRIAISLLEMNPLYQNWERSKLLMHIDRGVVPILNDIKCLNLGEFVEDAIIIEGVLMDRVTRITYYAPFHLSKTTRRVLLPEHPQWDFHTIYETRLLLIPDASYEEDFVFSKDALFLDHHNETLPSQVTDIDTDSTDVSSTARGTELRKRKAVGFIKDESPTITKDKD